MSFLQAIFAIHLAATLGYLVHGFLEHAGLKLPLFVPALLSGILLSNTIPYIMPKVQWPSRTTALALIADVSLGIFLAMSLMSMQLWTLVELAAPIPPCWWPSSSSPSP